MDGKGAWRDNVFVERLWRSVKYEEVYLRAYETVGEARHSIGRYLDFYNARRPYSSLDDMPPDQAYFNLPPLRVAALISAEAPLIDAESLFRQAGPALSVLPPAYPLNDQPIVRGVLHIRRRVRRPRSLPDKLSGLGHCTYRSGTFPPWMESVRQSKRTALQIGQTMGTEYPISSAKRWCFMLWSSSWARANFKLD
ncbi:hypothetical protein ACVWW7_004945 [Bradyrhizobium sp. LM6.9]